MSHWDTLGIAPTDERKTIKRAYSKLLKITRPEENPAGFQKLHEAYEFALAHINSNSDNHIPQEPQTETKRPIDNIDPSQASLSNPPSFNTEYKLEQQSSAVTYAPKQDKAWSPWTIVDKVITPTYDESDEISLIILWKELINTDDFYNLDKKSALEAAFLQALANHEGQYYPVNLFVEIYNYYDWNNAGQHLQEYFEALDYLNARIHSALLYQEIVDTKKGNNKEARAEEQDAAKCILAKTPPKISAYFHFFTLTGGRVKDYLHTIEDANPLIMQEELNTPTVKWWHKQFERTHFTFLHMALAFIVALFPMDYFQSWIIESSDVSTSVNAIPIIYSVLSLILSFVIFIIHIGVKRLYHSTLKPIRERAVDKYYVSLARQITALTLMTALAAFSFKYPDGFHGLIPIVITLFLVLTQSFVRLYIITAAGTIAWVIFNASEPTALITEPLPLVAVSIWSLAALVFWTGFEVFLQQLPKGLRNWVKNDGEIYSSGTYNLFFIPMLFFSFKGIYLLFEQLEKLL